MLQIYHLFLAPRPSLADRFSRTTSNHDLRACARARERETAARNFEHMALSLHIATQVFFIGLGMGCPEVFGEN